MKDDKVFIVHILRSVDLILMDYVVGRISSFSKKTIFKIKTF